ncbi:MAG: trypsin-like peptidase domain-containing protein [Proteobacteria bacterium]|nr:trypsin-like peptidase domain-containing protein [Pseudomonadota bacterium]
MKNFVRLIQFVAQFVTLGLALAFIVTLLAPQWIARPGGGAESGPSPSHAAGPAADAAPVEAVRPPSPTSQGGANFGPTSSKPATAAEGPVAFTASYSHAVEAAGPAVVSIFVNKVEEQRGRPQLFRTRDPNQPLVLGQVVTNVPVQNLGSGVIVNSDGYVLTNYHVIKSATNISVVLSDGRSKKAQVVGSDEETDLAVLKLDVANQPSVAIASKPAAVGDVVLAIGNPFGLDKTVTMGIISAVGRIDPKTGEDFIQTDAAINSGNSGGALVNAYGELVGINSNTWSPSETGGNIGIGFAIPVAIAKRVLEQIIDHGRVIRAWMGVRYRDVPPAADDPMPVVTGGALVAALQPDGPAAKAGLLTGDVITRVDGKWIQNASALRNRETYLAPGATATLTVQRDGKQLQFKVELVERPSDSSQSLLSPGAPPNEG